MISKEERESREAICQQCPDLVKNSIPFAEKVIERCGVCGCLIIGRVFTWCPKSKF
jgi:hypothetical protein